MDIEISKELLRLHILPHRKGYTYFKEALLAMNQRAGNIQNYVREIYLFIAENHGITTGAVIKAMTACICDAIKTDEEYFSDCIAENGRISLKEFLIKIYDLIFYKQ